MSADKPVIDYTNKDYAALREALLELGRERSPGWTDQSENDFGVVLVELFSYMGDLILHYLDRVANESYLETALERRSVLNMLRLIGYELSSPQPASADLTLRFEGVAAVVQIPSLAEFTSTKESTGTPVHFRYLGAPLTLDIATLPVDPSPGSADKLYTSLPVTQVDRVIGGEILGSSDGSPGQRYRLAQPNPIDGTLELTVDEGAGPVLWARVETLLTSESGDRHYLVKRDASSYAWIEFGNGKTGKLPRRGRNNILAEYLVGGGELGNVPAMSIAEAATEIDHLLEISNPFAASGGAAAETIESGAERGRQQFRSMGRAVTKSDYEYHARLFGVGKVRARGAGWNSIELFVAPQGGGYPSDTLEKDLLAYFEDRRMMTSILKIRDPVYVDILIAGTLEVEPNFFTDQVRQEVLNAVAALFDFDAVDFEDRLYVSKVYEAIEAIEGVAGVNLTAFDRAGLAGATPGIATHGRLSLGWNEIPIMSADMTLTHVSGGRGGN